MWSSRNTFLALALSMVLAAGCGYQFAGSSSSAPFVLPEGHRTLAMKEVVNPTLETWLEPDLRSMIRDEFSKRGKIRWTPLDQADATMSVQVLKYSETANIKNERGDTLKREVRLSLEAKLFNRSDGLLIWESGPIAVYETYLQGGLQEAREAVTARAIRMLADRMAHAY